MYKPFKPHNPLPIEETFDKFIDSVGGVRVSTLVGPSPPFPNADYLFADKNVVIELKTLTTDWPQLKEYQQKISDLWLRCEILGRVSNLHAEGRIPIPRDVRRDFLQLLRKPLKRILEKANRQIRDTRVHLKREEDAGVLLLVIDGLLTVAPQFLIALLSKILLHEYSAINCFVVITVNEYVDIPNDEYARILWVPAYQEEAPESLVSFIDDLGRQWFTFLEPEVGRYDTRSETADISFLEGASFVKYKR